MDKNFITFAKIDKNCRNIYMFANCKTDNDETLIDNIRNAWKYDDNHICGLYQKRTLRIFGKKHILEFLSPMQSDCSYALDGDKYFSWHDLLCEIRAIANDEFYDWFNNDYMNI